jgi:2-amino-4-hydroxy-6-hydroxymethyldihydropteridine diphosphokinase
MTRAFLGLGSNLGDRLGYLRSAVAALDRGTRVSVVRASKVYETDPVEVGDDHPPYLNSVVEVECGVSAVELLRFCQGVEAALGREEKGSMSPRTVDVDVLLFLDPGLRIPGRGVVGELLEGLDSDGVREVEGEKLR